MGISLANLLDRVFGKQATARRSKPRRNRHLNVESLESRYAMAWTFMLQGDPQSPQAYRVLHDHALNIGTNNSVLINDMAFDPSQGYRMGLQLGATLVSGPSHASSFQFNSNGTFSYTGAAGFTGTDIFTYRATYTDQNNVTWTSTSTATAVITVYNTPVGGMSDLYEFLSGGRRAIDAQHGALVNDGDPSGQAQNMNPMTMNETGASRTTFTDYDGDTFWATLVSGPAHASFFEFHADGSFVYESEVGFAGIDEIEYRVTDGVFVSQPVKIYTTVVRGALYLVEPEKDANGDWFNQSYTLLARQGVPDIAQGTKWIGEKVELRTGMTNKPASKLEFMVKWFIEGPPYSHIVYGANNSSRDAIEYDPLSLGKESDPFEDDVDSVQNAGANEGVSTEFFWKDADTFRVTAVYYFRDTPTGAWVRANGNATSTIEVKKPDDQMEAYTVGKGHIELIDEGIDEGKWKVSSSPSFEDWRNDPNVSALLASGDPELGHFAQSSYGEGIAFRRFANGIEARKGKFQWVQTVQVDAYEILPDGSKVRAPGKTGPEFGLDTQYPYSLDQNYTADSPGMLLSPLTGPRRFVYEFSATMYLEWTSELPGSVAIAIANCSYRLDYFDVTYNPATDTLDWTGLAGILSITDPPHNQTTIVEWDRVVITGA